MSNVMTPVFRVSHPNVFKARRNDQNGKDEFSLDALYDEGADLSNLKAEAQKAIVKKWGADKAKWPKNLKTPFRDQGDREKTDDKGKTFLPAGYKKGAVYMKLRTDRRPGVVDAQVQPIVDPSEFYGGCYARATIRFFAYDKNGNRGVSCSLANVQKVRDGEPFGAGKVAPEDDFAPIEGAASSSADDLFG